MGPVAGAVKSWRGMWGFFVSERFVGDVFCHADSVLSSTVVPRQGLQVRFYVVQDAKGRICAKDAIVIGTAAGAPSSNRQPHAAKRLRSPAAAGGEIPGVIGPQAKRIRSL